MGRIYHFEAKHARRGGVLCRPIGVVFPQLFRVEQTMTREMLDAFGAPDIEPFEGTVHYTLNDETHRDRYPGATLYEPVKAISSGDPSFVIRRHLTRDFASGYMDALRDQTDDEAFVRELCETDQGVFTLAQRPTEPEWPGPLLIYLAEVPANNVLGSDCWYRAIAPTGEPHTLPYYESPTLSE